MSDPSEDFVPWGLLVVDMQRYYVEKTAPFFRYHDSCTPGCIDYIQSRCADTVTPNIRLLLTETRALERPVIFLRLCGKEEDRSDLHGVFRKSHLAAAAAGFPNLYPLETHPLSKVATEIAPKDGEHVLCKTTFSGFTTSKLSTVISAHGIQRLVVTGLATSQCVETTARDAADRGIRVVQVHDAQADFCEETHRASLFSSQGVCGGHILSTKDVLAAPWFR